MVVQSKQRADLENFKYLMPVMLDKEILKIFVLFASFCKARLPKCLETTFLEWKTQRRRPHNNAAWAMEHFGEFSSQLLELWRALFLSEGLLQSSQHGILIQWFLLTAPNHFFT